MKMRAILHVWRPILGLRCNCARQCCDHTRGRPGPAHDPRISGRKSECPGRKSVPPPSIAPGRETRRVSAGRGETMQGNRAACVLVLILALVAAHPAQQPSIAWEADFDEALKAAKA